MPPPRSILSSIPVVFSFAALLCLSIGPSCTSQLVRTPPDSDSVTDASVDSTRDAPTLTGDASVDSTRDAPTLTGDGPLDTAPSPDAPPVVSSGDILPQLILTPSTGIAPLAVHLDATGTSWESHNELEVLRGLTFEWDFGDPQSGNWSRGVLRGSRNSECCAPLAAHVYQQAGTYTIKLNVRRGLSDVGTLTRTVTVHDVAGTQGIPSAQWLCLSQTSDFSGCPTGAEHRTVSSSQLATETTKAMETQGFRRLLFKRGQSWTLAGNAVSVSSKIKEQVIVEDFGQGDLPRFIFADSADWRSMFGSAYAGGKVTFRNLVVDGGDDTHQMRAFSAGKRTLVLGCQATRVSVAINIQGRNDVTVADGEFVRIGVGNGHGLGAWVHGERFALLGSQFHDLSRGQHVVRIQGGPRAVVAHNELTKPANGKHSLTIRGITDHYAVIDNVIAESQLWALYIGPQNADSPEEVVDYGVVERNIIAGQLHPLAVGGPRLVVRNNLFFTEDTVCIGVSRRCPTCARPDNVDFLHNNCFSPTDRTDVDARLFNISSSSGSRLVNNLLFAPNSSRLRLVQGTVALESHNLATSANLFGGTPSASQPTAAQFQLTASASAAIDQGLPLEDVLYDLFGNLRTTPDIGAHER